MATAQLQSTLSAGARVANIPELLEQILLGLATDQVQDLFTLVLSQRTCHAFHDTITSTPSLQRALFFQTIPTTGRPKLNPLCDRSKAQPIILADGTNLVFKIFDGYPWPKAGMIKLKKSSVRVSRYAYDQNKRGKMTKNERYMNTYGSWRQMRVFQEAGHPPIVELLCDGLRGKRVEGEWVNPTLGEIFDLLHPHEHAYRAKRLAREGKRPW